MAFYAMMLGKEGSDIHWCIWCKLAKKDWQKWPYEAENNVKKRYIKDLVEFTSNLKD
jgi:hypothetical protein